MTWLKQVHDEGGPVRWDGRGARYPKLRADPPATGRPKCQTFFLRRPMPGTMAIAVVRMLNRVLNPEALAQHQRRDRRTASEYVRHATARYFQDLKNLKCLLARPENKGFHGDIENLMLKMQATAPRHRWKYPFRADYELAKDSLGYAGLSAPEKAVIDQQWDAAETRIGKLVDQWHGDIPIVGLAPMPGPQLRLPPPSWQVHANRLLSGGGDPGDLELTCGMYFMHAFHAHGGFVQFDPTDWSAWDNPRWWRRPHSYAALLRLLEHSCVKDAEEDFSIRNTAKLIAAGLGGLPLFAPRVDSQAPHPRPEEGTNAARLEALRSSLVADRRTADPNLTSRLQELHADLPPEFGPYLGGRAPNVEFCAAYLKSPNARHRLRIVHHIAEMLLDMLFDTLKVRLGPDHGQPQGVPGFDLDCYTYFHSLGHGHAPDEDEEVQAHHQNAETRLSYLGDPAHVAMVWSLMPPLSPLPIQSHGGTACAWCRLCPGRQVRQGGTP